MDFWEILALSQAGKALKKASDNSVLRWKGSVATYSDLPDNASQGDVYHVDADNQEYAWDGTGWEPLGDIVIVDSALSSTSENPVQNKVIYAKMTSTAQEDAIYHLGFYIDENGDLCY